MFGKDQCSKQFNKSSKEEAGLDKESGNKYHEEKHKFSLSVMKRGGFYDNITLGA